MDKDNSDLGVIQVLMDRLVKFQLPKALRLKSRVDKGGRLTDEDIAFLHRLLDDVPQERTLIARHPEYRELAGRMASLYDDITRKALENERNQRA